MAYNIDAFPGLAVFNMATCLEFESKYLSKSRVGNTERLPKFYVYPIRIHFKECTNILLY